MAKGITIESAGGMGENEVFVLRKSRGKLSLDDIGEFLQQEKQGFYQGNYVICLNATESAMGGSGWFEEDSKGDCVEVIRINGEVNCPVCSKMLPPDYCPDCGATLSKKEGR